MSWDVNWVSPPYGAGLGMIITWGRGTENRAGVFFHPFPGLPGARHRWVPAQEVVKATRLIRPLLEEKEEISAWKRIISSRIICKQKWVATPSSNKAAGQAAAESVRQ